MEKTTNLEKIKEVARKYFDAHDISAEPVEAFPMPDGKGILREAHCHLYHPVFRGFWIENIFDAEVALYKALKDPVEFEKVKAKLLADIRTALNEVEEPEFIFSLLMSPYDILFIKETKQFLSPSDYSWALRTTDLASHVTHSPAERAQLKSDIQELFDESFVRQDFMYDVEKKYYDALPDVVTVYHGVSEETEDYEISDIFYWTSEIEQLVPTEDCRSHESEFGVVYEAKIKKEDIYGYFSLEDTVFLNPDKLFNVLCHKDFPLEDIELHDKDLIRLDS